MGGIAICIMGTTNERSEGKFLRVLTLPAPPTAVTARPAPTGVAPSPTQVDPAALQRLKQWRLEVARAEGVPAFVVFHDRTLAEIAARSPRDLAELETVSGVGPAKLVRYGEQVLTVLRSGES